MAWQAIAELPDDRPNFFSYMATTEKLPPLERYIRILELLSAFQDGLMLSELSVMIDLPKASAHRLLKNLQELELAVPVNPGGSAFVLGPRMQRLALMSANSERLEAVIRPFLRALAADLGETTFVARLESVSVRTVAYEAPDSPWRGFVLPGYDLYPNAAASAKAILAFQDQQTLDRALIEPFMQLTSRTNLSKARLLAEYEEIRRTGVATCIGEIDEGLAAIAVPICVGGRSGMYSLGVTGPIARLVGKNVSALAEKMRACAANIAVGLTIGSASRLAVS